MGLFYTLETKTLHCDSDGSSRAYAYDTKDQWRALDKSGNAKHEKTGEWSKAVVVFKNGKPYVQTEGANKGMLISKIPLHLRKVYKGETFDTIIDPTAYIDPEIFPYFVMPKPNRFGMQFGDIAYVENRATKMYTFAVFADAHDGKYCEEGSLKLQRDLGYAGSITNEDYSGDFFFILFPISGYGENFPLTTTGIDLAGEYCMRFRLKDNLDGKKLYDNSLYITGGSRMPAVYNRCEIKKWYNR
ncbi:hypothetical protein ACI6Q2_10280 [Chitinophagaceae bacterium LWZ2-11]